MEPLVDTRLLAKPKTFEGDANSWREFKFSLLCYCGCIDAELPDAMEWAMFSADPVHS